MNEWTKLSASKVQEKLSDAEIYQLMTESAPLAEVKATKQDEVDRERRINRKFTVDDAVSGLDGEEGRGRRTMKRISLFNVISMFSNTGTGHMDIRPLREGSPHARSPRVQGRKLSSSTTSPSPKAAGNSTFGSTFQQYVRANAGAKPRGSQAVSKSFQRGTTAAETAGRRDYACKRGNNAASNSPQARSLRNPGEIPSRSRRGVYKSGKEQTANESATRPLGGHVSPPVRSSKLQLLDATFVAGDYGTQTVDKRRGEKSQDRRSPQAGKNRRLVSMDQSIDWSMLSNVSPGTVKLPYLPCDGTSKKPAISSKALYAVHTGMKLNVRSIKH